MITKIYSPQYLSEDYQARIMSITGIGNYSRLNFDNGKKIMMGYTLKGYEHHIHTFIRINRADLINPTFVKSLNYGENDGDFVVMQSGDRLAISRRRVAEVSIRLHTEFNRRMNLVIS